MLNNERQLETQDNDKLTAWYQKKHRLPLKSTIHFNAATRDLIRDVVRMSVPSWPLQNTVAVNPFWNFRDQHIWPTMNYLKSVLHQYPLMPVSYFTEKYEKGEITTSALRRSLSETTKIWPTLPSTTSEFIAAFPKKTPVNRKFTTVAEITPHALDLHQFVRDEIGKIASSYFDTRQALIQNPWQGKSLWKMWQSWLLNDRSLQVIGIGRSAETLNKIVADDPTESIERVLQAFGIHNSQGRYFYLQRALSTVLGWASHVAYLQWQKGLDHPTDRSAQLEELLAIRVMYDYLIWSEYHTKNLRTYQKWTQAFQTFRFEDLSDDEHLGYLATWQLAAELSYQQYINDQLLSPRLKSQDESDVEFVFCIDVRSEMIRRHLEEQDPRISTRGFAGFFGAPVQVRRAEESGPRNCLPVLLKPSLFIEEKVSTHESAQLDERLIRQSFYRNLRKTALGSFLFVELFGILSFVDLVSKTKRALFSNLWQKKTPSRFRPVQIHRHQLLHFHNRQSLTLEDRVNVAANALNHMGYRHILKKWIVIVGHGSSTTNNAFNSALDCGACGGHAGDVNAQLMVSVLNDPEVRVALHQRGYYISAETRFVAALHETVSDEIQWLNTTGFEKDERWTIIQGRCSEATRDCQAERQYLRSDFLDRSPYRRSNNWSEVRPEWALAGNACFIVAPRARTLGTNLSGRSFLHDYDWSQDKDFKTLELIMTAPMIVTNWINMQYFGSVVAPQTYSSGSKTLHNLTNESYVVEGNGGDLRVGLPLQSVHDGQQYVHEPLRLSVFIEAPIGEIERIILKHQVVKDLVHHEWLHLLQIDPETKKIHRRDRDGFYHCIS